MKQKQIPEEYRNQFKSFVDFKDFMLERAKNQLTTAFDKIDIDEIKNRKENIKTNIWGSNC